MRQQMIKGQLQPQKITDPDMLAAFGKVPREMFIDLQFQIQSYHDYDLRVYLDQSVRYLLSPRKLAKLFSFINFSHKPKILIIGFATGYSLAIAYELGAKVYGIEENNLLFSFGQTALQHYFDAFYELTNFDDLLFIDQNKLSEGFPEHGLYDYILIEGGIEYIPDGLLEQLRPHGQLISIYLNNPLGVFTCSKEGTIRHETYEKAYPLMGFQKQKGFSL